jgi:hypothetical protein
MASTLESELAEALRSEYGALVAYSRLARLTRDPALAGVFGAFVQDERRQIEELIATTRALGIEPCRPSLRRRLLAEVLAWSALFGARGLALRTCQDAEETRARWYGHLAEFLRAAGERRFDASFQRMSLLKLHHAQTLGAWVRSD